MQSRCTACHQQPQHNGHLCTPCATLLHHNLAAAPGMAQELLVELTRQARKAAGPSGRGGGDGGQPLPFDVTASVCLDRLRQALVEGVAIVTYGEPVDLDGVDVPRLAGWLLARFGELQIRAAVGEFALTLDAALKRAGRAIDTPPERVYIGDCTCSRPGQDPVRLLAVRSAPDEQGRREERWHQCPRCGTRFGVEDKLAELEERCRDQLLTAKEAALLAGVKPRLVRSWAERGRLQGRGVNRDGVAVYRFGDVLGLRG